MQKGPIISNDGLLVYTLWKVASSRETLGYFNACKIMPVLQLFVKARQQLGEVLSAFEFLDSQALDLTLRELEGVKNPLPNTSAPFYLVVETSGSNAEHDSAKLEVRTIFSACLPCQIACHWKLKFYPTWPC